MAKGKILEEKIKYSIGQYLSSDYVPHKVIPHGIAKLLEKYNCPEMIKGYLHPRSAYSVRFRAPGYDIESHKDQLQSLNLEAFDFEKEHLFVAESIIKKKIQILENELEMEMEYESRRMSRSYN